MKSIFALIILCGMMVGCRGRDGKDGTNGLNGTDGGETQIFTGVTNVAEFGVQVDNFGEQDGVSVYYALASANTDYFEMKGPDSPLTTTPYYAILGTNGSSSVVIRLYNLPVGTYYRILIWRPARLI